MPRLNLLGSPPFGRLVVIADAGTLRGISRWVCRCKCGNQVTVILGHLRSGHTTSCGCLCKELAARKGHEKAIHGLSRTPIYGLWASMHNRCYLPSHPAYKNYGGRGIIVCERWHTFEYFLADMGMRPEGRTLDRYPDKNGNYSPDNCRWATRKEQQRNRRDNVYITFQGRTMLIVEWAELLRIKFVTLWWRLQNWSIERALTEPVHQNRNHH